MRATGDTDVNDLTRAQKITQQLAIGTHRLSFVRPARKRHGIGFQLHDGRT